jgi:predicted nucleotidyltransferase
LDLGTLSVRRKIAREAANLLYSGFEKEYKQAKIKAAKTFGVHLLPTNLEVAIELDRVAAENEGSSRMDRLIQMREEALVLMQILKEHKPVLIGSVWRGTIHHNSDIDIIVYHDHPDEVLKLLRHNNVKIMQTERVAVTKKGKRNVSFHIHVECSAGEKAEIKVSGTEEAAVKAKCEIYGDLIVGLRIEELMKTLKENPVQRFVPF